MKNIIISILISIIAAYITVQAVGHPQEIKTITKQAAYERVMQNKTLRCGYGIWSPGLVKDAKTGKLGGVFYDYLEAVGQHTGIKIEWAEEVGWGDFPAALNAGRIDAMCFGAWPKETTAKEVLFTEPTYFLPFNAYVRAGDTRFDDALDKANSSDIKISTMDSGLSSQLASSRFPAVVEDHHVAFQTADVLLEAAGFVARQQVAAAIVVALANLEGLRVAGVGQGAAGLALLRCAAARLDGLFALGAQQLVESELRQSANLPFGRWRMKASSASTSSCERKFSQRLRSLSNSRAASRGRPPGLKLKSPSSEVLSHGICPPCDCRRTARRTRLKTSSTAAPGVCISRSRW